MGWKITLFKSSDILNFLLLGPEPPIEYKGFNLFNLNYYLEIGKVLLSLGCLLKKLFLPPKITLGNLTLNNFLNCLFSFLVLLSLFNNSSFNLKF